MYFGFLAVLFAVLFVPAPSIAQQCSKPVSSGLYNYTQTPPVPPVVSTYFPDNDFCNGTDNTDTYTVQVFQHDYCLNTNNNASYDVTNPDRTTFGNGVDYCTTSSLLPDLMCDPRIEAATSTATSTTDYNRFYIRVYDAIVGQYCGTATAISRQDVYQCSAIACTNGSGAGGCAPKGSPTCGSPIVIDVGGNGFALTDAPHGVKFDISASGTPVQMAWTAPGADNAFLALPGADGLVHNAAQLFGNSTPQPQSATPNGFAALAVYDQPANGGNGDGIIDSRDAIFSSLRLWIDANHDGISQPEELHTLPSLGVNSISLNYKADERTDQWGNVFHYRAQVNPGGATTTGRIAYDVFFVEANTTTKNMNLAPPVGSKCQVPDKKVGMMATAGGSR